MDLPFLPSLLALLIFSFPFPFLFFTKKKSTRNAKEKEKKRAAVQVASLRIDDTLIGKKNKTRKKRGSYLIIVYIYISPSIVSAQRGRSDLGQVGRCIALMKISLLALRENIITKVVSTLLRVHNSFMDLFTYPRISAKGTIKI